jgi:hypothetical protein
VSVERLRANLLTTSDGTTAGKAFTALLFTEQLELLNSQVDYVRHGTATLFAALEVAIGKVTDACFGRHRHQELPAFLKLVAKTYPA